MKQSQELDAIIIGGSYAGLSAAMALGRSLRNVLVIDSGEPCNRQTPHSHNFITQDGETPAAIAAKAKAQVLDYKTVRFVTGKATEATRQEDGFRLLTEAGEFYTAKKLLFATGVKDHMPDIEGFAACWGISVLHCPYCHGYEVHGRTTGVLGNGDMGFEFTKVISNWTNDLTLFTNGPSALTPDQTAKLQRNQIRIVENEIQYLEHERGYIKNIVSKEGERFPVTALYARVPFTQHSHIPQELGCETTEAGYIKVDEFQKTSVGGVYAAGDNTTMFRAVSMAVAAGTKAGSMLNKELIEDTF